MVSNRTENTKITIHYSALFLYGYLEKSVMYSSKLSKVIIRTCSFSFIGTLLIGQLTSSQ
jgi:hypothetical protein